MTSNVAAKNSLVTSLSRCLVALFRPFGTELIVARSALTGGLRLLLLWCAPQFPTTPRGCVGFLGLHNAAIGSHRRIAWKTSVTFAKMHRV